MQRLPIEIMTYIANSLELLDIFNLGLTCHQFRYLITNDDICRTALEAHALFSAELRDARSSKHYARTFRRLVKTRQSVTTATPYSVALVACADDFIYSNGILCYTVGYEWLRLLNLHQSASTETIINTRALLQSVEGENLGNNKYKFRPIHYADGILSCLYTPPKTEGLSRLIVVDVGTRQLLTCHLLESHQKLFVRNNQDHLYYGTHSLMGDDGFRRWVLKRFSILEKKWVAGRLDLEDLVGSDIGATVCFEIIDDHFYGLSSLTTFEVYETDWTSWYYGFRFPVGSSHPQDMQLTSKESMWRRHHEEGPIDDRWSTLSLEKDSNTGKLMVVECRREYLVDDCSSTRTSYRTELKFLANSDFNNADGILASRRRPGDAEDASGSARHENLTAGAKTHPPSLTHRGDGGSATQSITLTHCFLRSYNQSCETFIDLVNDPLTADSMIQRPQLRSISCLRAAEISQQQTEPSASVVAMGNQASNRSNRVSWWLPETNGQQRNTHLDALDYILNPKGKSQHNAISGVMDDRSIVYAVGQRSAQSKRPLVFISFDPSIILHGIDHWPGGPTAQPPPFRLADGVKTNPTPQSMPASAPDIKNTFNDEDILDPPKQPTNPGPEAGSSAWGKIVPATYLELRSLGTTTGFNFAHCGDHPGSFQHC